MTNAAKFGGGSTVDVYAECRRRPPAGVRARPRAGLRPGRRAGRPPRRARVDRRPHGAPRRPRPHHQLARRRARRSSSCWRRAMSDPRVLIVDDHQLFRSGVRAELEPLLRDRRRGRHRRRGARRSTPSTARRRPARRAHARRRRRRGDPPRGERPGCARFLALSVSDAAEDVIAVIRAGARGYVTKKISRARAGRRRAPRARRRRGLLAAAGGLRARRLRRPRAAARDRARPAHPARARGAPAHRAGLHVQGDRPAPGISAKTVEAHVSSVLRKLQLSSRHELTRWAGRPRPRAETGLSSAPRAPGRSRALLALLDGAALVVLLLALGDRELDLRPRAREVDPRRHDRQPLLGRLADQPLDLALVQQQLARPLGIVVLARRARRARCACCAARPRRRAPRRRRP